MRGERYYADDPVNPRVEAFLLLERAERAAAVHARKGDCECKFWLNAELYEIEEDWSYNLTPRLRREVRRIIFDHFDLIADEWSRHIEGQRHAKD